ETGASEAESSGKAGIRTPRRKGGHCGAGVFPHISPAPSATVAPFLIYEVSAALGWDSGTMDPGPVGAVPIVLARTSRQLTGSSPDGRPLYSGPVTDHRSSRLEPGEEYLVPVLVDARGREALGVHEVLLRIRAGWAGREGATAYGALAVVEAAPG